MSVQSLRVRPTLRRARGTTTLGLVILTAALLLAPQAASAAPLSPGKKGPSYGPDLVPEAYARVYENGAVEAQVTVRNDGSSAAAPVRVRLTLPPSFAVTRINRPVDAECVQAGATVTCTTATLDAQEHVLFSISGTPGTTGRIGFRATVDPDSAVSEASERNNTVDFESVVF